MRGKIGNGILSSLWMDGWMSAFLIVFLSRHNTVLGSGIMAFSEVWQGGSRCCIVLIADWGGGGNVISDWSVARVGWKFDVYWPVGISENVWVRFFAGKTKERWHCSCVNFVPLQYIEQEWLCSLYAGLCKSAFCFAKDFMSFLDCITPWG